MTAQPRRMPLAASHHTRRSPALRWLALGVVAQLGLVGCAASSDFSASPVGSPHGVQLTASVVASDDAVDITYSVENRSDQPVIVADGIPAADTTNLPEPAENAAYVTASGDTTVFSRKSFDGLPADDDSAPWLLMGQLLLPGETHQGEIDLTDPWNRYSPGQDTAPISASERTQVKFCLGVVSPEAIDADLQANTTEDRPVLHHGITQVTLCSDPVASQT